MFSRRRRRRILEAEGVEFAEAIVGDFVAVTVAGSAEAIAEGFVAVTAAESPEATLGLLFGWSDFDWFGSGCFGYCRRCRRTEYCVRQKLAHPELQEKFADIPNSI